MPDDAVSAVPFWAVASITIVQTFTALVPALWLSMKLAARPFHAADGESWVERAQASWPLQTLYGIAYAVSLGALIAWQFLRWTDTERLFAGPAAWCACGVVIVVMLWASRRTYALVHGELPARRTTLHTTAFMWIVQWATLPIVFIAMRFCPRQFDERAVLVYIATLAALLVLNFGGSMALLRLFRVARPASEKTQAILEAAAARCGFAAPPVYELDLSYANAWAFPTTGQVGVTRKLVADLEPDELESILLHETAHVQESRGEVAKRLLMIPFVASMAWMPVILSNYRLKGIYLYLLAFYGVIFWSRRIAHRLEVEADAFSTRCVISPACYARGLEKIYRLNLVPAVMGRISPTHPDLYDRMLAAGVEPDYKRPPRPSRTFGIVTKLLFFVLLVVGLFITEIGVRVVLHRLFDAI